MPVDSIPYQGRKGILMISRIYLLTLLLIAAQGLLAWHGPSHLVPADEHAGNPVLQASDCDLCSFGQGLATAPVLAPAAPAPRNHGWAPARMAGHSAPTIPGAGARAPPVLS
jgi:hypothetical protein